MGDMARMAREERFREAFGKHMIAVQGLQIGDVLTVIGAGVAGVGNNDHMEVFYALKRQSDGKHFELCTDDNLFDLEYASKKDIREQAVEILGLDAELADELIEEHDL